MFDSQVLVENYNDLMASLIDCNFFGYPMDYQRVDQKTIPVIDNLSLFSGSKVLEVGSNFGMYSLLLSSISKVVTSLEVDPNIYTVSLRWKSFFEEKGYLFKNLTILNDGVASIKKYDYDSLLLSLVLYHLTDEEIDKLIEDAKLKCSKIIIQCRPSRIIAKSKGAFDGHVSKNNKFDGLCDIASNVRFLHAIGFKDINITVSPKLLGDEVFPVLVSER